MANKDKIKVTERKTWIMTNYDKHLKELKKRVEVGARVHIDYSLDKTAEGVTVHYWPENILEAGKPAESVLYANEGIHILAEEIVKFYWHAFELASDISVKIRAYYRPENAEICIIVSQVEHG